MNQCKSIKNNKEPFKQCNRSNLKDDVFCGLHNKSRIYYQNKVISKFKNSDKVTKKIKIIIKKRNQFYNKKLYKIYDKLYYENLMCIYDSFQEVPLNYLVYIDNKIWDIRLLIENWGNLLTSSEMQNSSPIFPSNPFTRKNLSIEDIKNVIECVKSNNIKLYSPLKYLFLNLNKINLFDSFNTNSELSKKIIELLNEKFRFRLLNKKDSQDNYIGLWVYKNEIKSDFEIFYEYYDSIPIQVQDIYGQIFDNYEKIHTKKLLDNYPKENININMYLESL